MTFSFLQPKRSNEQFFQQTSLSSVLIITYVHSAYLRKLNANTLFSLYKVQSTYGICMSSVQAVVAEETLPYL